MHKATMTPDTQLYNSRILDSYIKVLRKSYRHVDISNLLNACKIKPHEIEDEGHWFTQDQVDLFYEKLKKVVGHVNIAREAGVYSASPDAIGTLRYYLLGMVGPSKAFEMIPKIAQKVSRSALCVSRKISSNKFEITVSPYEGIDEKFFQCENRFGWFESLLRIFNIMDFTIDHPDCLFKDGRICRYIVSWKRPLFSYKCTIIIIGNLFGIALLTVGYLFRDRIPLNLILPFTLALVSAVFLIGEKMEKIRISRQFDSLRAMTDKAIAQINENYNKALLTNDLGQVIGQKIDKKEILKNAVERISEHLGFSQILIFLVDLGKMRLDLKMAKGYMEPFSELTLAFTETRGLVSTVYGNRKSLWVSDISEFKADFSSEEMKCLEKLELRSFACCPVCCGKETVGILVAAFPSPEKKLVQSDLNLLSGIASFIGISVRNADLFETMQQQIIEIKERDNALSKYREGLEVQVASRTFELKGALARAEEASRAKSEFLAMMSHEPESVRLQS